MNTRRDNEHKQIKTTKKSRDTVPCRDHSRTRTQHSS